MDVHTMTNEQLTGNAEVVKILLLKALLKEGYISEKDATEAADSLHIIAVKPKMLRRLLNFATSKEEGIDLMVLRRV